ncbi:Ger(x)C family spore germination protein [Paenibacillus sp. BSR1-1]|uniref:Ger(x)C family spore germination protein n=1 Tax=Paenibacillus sp. BSR1-1 TaxID=3020845 RepID=UPI0025B0C992|nr:Ger(x)C family spore germination protein [Paenibacillus sp. BSR1-1]MDN3016284.1 Ger(x)C family spore germination protein [Paenibacillus sp. BSR1-1]
MVNRLAVWLFLILLLTGCSFLPTNIVNEINLIQGVGYDLAGKNNIKGTVVFPIIKKGSSYSEVKTAFGQSSKEIRTKLSNETRFRLVSGQLRLTLYGKTLAKQGINDFVDTLNRDPSIGSLIQLAIVDGDTNELLKMKKYKEENISIYLQEMLDQNMEYGRLPRTDLQTFLLQLFQIGQDPYLPLIKKVDHNIQITGMAIFNYDQYVTSISLEELFIFKALLDQNRNGLNRFILKNGDKVVLETLNSNTKYKVKIVNGRPEYIIHLKMKTKLQEFAPSKKKRQAFDKKKYQKQVEHKLEKNALKMINQFKNHQVDPLGFGAKYKEHYRGFNEKQWKKFYPNVKVRVIANVDIRQTGIVD